MKSFLKISSIFFLLTLLLNSCKKDNQTEIVLEYPLLFLDNMEIDEKNIDSLIVRETLDFPTTLEGDLAKNNTSKEKIKSAKLVMDYAYDDSSKYSNLKDLSFMSLDIKHSNIGQKLIASKSIADMKTRAINLDLEDAEVKDYLKQDKFRMVVKYIKRRAMPHEMPFVISLRFRIVADPL